MQLKSRYLFLFSVILFGCMPDRVEQPGVPGSEEYFPLEVGRFIEYEVDSIVFDDAPGGNKMDTAHFQIREEVMSYQVFNDRDTLFYIHRFRRANSDGAWMLKDVWTARYDENNVLRTEENLTFRKMTLPLYKGLTWEATSYIHPFTQVKIGTENMEPYQYWQSRVLGIDEPGKIGIFMFPAGQVMRVSQTDIDDEVVKRFVHETYVRHIGLVSRTDTILDSRCILLGEFEPCLGKPWIEHAGKGYILSQVMIHHN